MRQEEKVIKKGNYYEVELNEEVRTKQDKTVRRDENPSAMNIPTASEHIITEMPEQTEARHSYFYVHDRSKF